MVRSGLQMCLVKLDCDGTTFARATQEEKVKLIGKKAVGKVEVNTTIVDESNHPLVWILPKLIPQGDQVSIPNI